MLTTLSPMSANQEATLAEEVQSHLPEKPEYSPPWMLGWTLSSEVTDLEFQSALSTRHCCDLKASTPQQKCRLWQHKEMWSTRGEQVLRVLPAQWMKAGITEASPEFSVCPIPPSSRPEIAFLPSHPTQSMPHPRRKMPNLSVLPSRTSCFQSCEE